MDLHSLSLDRRKRSAQVCAVDADGLHTVELDAAGCDRVAAAAQPLFDWAHGRGPASSRTPRDATLLAFEVDTQTRRLRLGYIAERSPPSGPPTTPGAPASPTSGSRPSGPGEPAALQWTEGDYHTLQGLLREAARTAVRELRPRRSEPAELSYDDRWEYLYQNGGDGWELGRAAPPLARYLTAQVRLAPGAKALVMGAGRGHEALLLGRLAPGRDTEIVAIDIAPSAVRATAAAVAAAGLGDLVKTVERDLFLQDATGVLAPSRYDLIVEHCCYCAVDPSRREEYIRQVARLLKPGGRFIGLFYCHSYPGGPPFGASMPEIEAQLSPAFVIDHGEVPSDSILTRATQEWLVDAHLREPGDAPRR